MHNRPKTESESNEGKNIQGHYLYSEIKEAIDMMENNGLLLSPTIKKIKKHIISIEKKIESKNLGKKEANDYRCNSLTSLLKLVKNHDQYDKIQEKKTFKEKVKGIKSIFNKSPLQKKYKKYRHFYIKQFYEVLKKIEFSHYAANTHREVFKYYAKDSIANSINPFVLMNEFHLPADLANIRKYSRLLTQAKKSPQSHFFNLPRVVLLKIASELRDNPTTEKEALEVANTFMGQLNDNNAFVVKKNQSAKQLKKSLEKK